MQPQNPIISLYQDDRTPEVNYQGNNPAPVSTPQQSQPFNFAPIPVAPQTSTNQGGNNQLDQTIVNLSKAIRQVESNGNFNARGKSGEYGAYQFMPDTWAKAAPTYLGQNIPLEQATPQQQNEVAYKRLSDLKKQGYNVGQIASIWNRGKPDWEGHVGDYKGVHYDTPAYVDKVSKTYQAYKGGQISPQSQSSLGDTQWQNPFGGDTGGDRFAGKNDYGALFPVKSTDNPLMVGAKAIGNLPTSYLEIGKGFYNILRHPIKTGIGLANVIMGGSEAATRKLLEHTPLADKIKQLPPDNQEQVFKSFVDSLKDKYGSLDNLERYAGDNPAQFGLDVVTAVQAASKVADLTRNAVSGLPKAQEALNGNIVNNTKMYDNYIKSGDMNPATVYKDVGNKIYNPEIAQHVIGDARQALTMAGHSDIADKLGQVLAGQTEITPDMITGTVQQLIDAKGGLVGNAVNQGISGVAQTAMAPIKALGRGIQNVVGGSLGVSSTVGAKSGQSALKSAMSDGRSAYQEAMRGNYTPDQMVDEASGGLDNMFAKRTQAYQKQLSQIAGNTKSYDISPLHTELDSQLNKFGITVSEDGTLDFSRSSIANSGPARADVQGVYDTLKNWGTKSGDRTAIGLDTLKQQLGDFYSPSSSARSFVQGVKSALWNPSEKSGILSNVDGYGKLTGDYAEATNYIKDLKSSLSLGGRAGVETTFNKLTQAIKGNSALKAQFVQELNQETGGTLIPHLAGSKMTQVFPGGLMGSLEGAGGTYALMSGAIGMKDLLPMLTVASPRIVGEFFNALGLSKQAIVGVLQYLNTPPVKAGLYGTTVTSDLPNQ